MFAFTNPSKTSLAGQVSPSCLLLKQAYVKTTAQPVETPTYRKILDREPVDLREERAQLSLLEYSTAAYGKKSTSLP